MTPNTKGIEDKCKGKRYVHYEIVEADISDPAVILVVVSQRTKFLLGALQDSQCTHSAVLGDWLTTAATYKA